MDEDEVVWGLEEDFDVVLDEDEVLVEDFDYVCEDVLEDVFEDVFDSDELEDFDELFEDEDVLTDEDGLVVEYDEVFLVGVDTLDEVEIFLVELEVFLVEVETFLVEEDVFFVLEDTGLPSTHLQRVVRALAEYLANGDVVLELGQCVSNNTRREQATNLLGVVESAEVPRHGELAADLCSA